MQRILNPSLPRFIIRLMIVVVVLIVIVIMTIIIIIEEGIGVILIISTESGIGEDSRQFR